MNKVTLKGITAAMVVSAISAVFMVVFHRSLSPEIVAFLPVVVSAVAGYFGINFSVKAEIKKEAREQN